MSVVDKSSDAKIRESVGIWQDAECCIPFVKGRVALYAILRTLGIGQGDEVLIPGFTCVVVPAAVHYTGATPVFYDIDPLTLHGDPALAIAGISNRTKAVLLQHNYGAIAPVGDLLSQCHARGIAVIEDCAHSMGAHRGDRPVGTLGTAAFCSLQWSKPTTTGLGGIARFNDPSLAAAGRDLAEKEFSEPARIKAIYLGILSSLFRSLYRPSWYWTARGFYRWAGRHGLIHGSSSPAELVTDTMPAGYQELFGTRRIGNLKTALAGLPSLLQHRRWVRGLYTEKLGHLETWLPPREAVGTVEAALRFTLLVENRDDLLRLAQLERLEIGSWFNAPLHPRNARAEVFGYRQGCCPRGEAASARTINLPTHRHVKEHDVEKIVQFVSRHGDFVTVDTLRGL